MKKTLIYLLTILSYTANSQDYTIESNFKADSTYHFTVKRAKYDSRDPMTKDLAQLTQIDATFTQAGKHLKCVWKYGETKVVGPEDIISQIGQEYNELLNLYRGFEIEVLYDPYSGGIELLNYAKMKENINNSLLKIYKHPTTKIDSAAIDLINQQLEPTYATPDFLLSTYFPEIVFYFNLYSQSFTKGIGIKSEYSYPNPFGGEAFPVVGVIGIDSKNGNVLVIKHIEEANQCEVNRILKDMIEKMSKLGDSPFKKEEMPDFTFNATSKYYYDLNRKLINKIVQEKIIEMTGITQTNILEVNLLE